MKKILILIMALSFVVPTKSHAFLGEFVQSDWFEPTMFCVGGAGAGYLASPDGDEGTYAAIGCGVGAIIGIFVNGYYKDKYGTTYQEKIQDLEQVIREQETMKAMKSAAGDEDETYSIKIREVVPGKKLPNGDVQAPTIREKLILPGYEHRIGE